MKEHEEFDPVFSPRPAMDWPVDITFNLHPLWVYKMTWNKWSLPGLFNSQESVLVVFQIGVYFKRLFSGLRKKFSLWKIVTLIT